MAAVGIDLGTTNSCIAIVKNGYPMVIANANGKRTTPSCVGFSKDNIDELLVGELAVKRTLRNYETTIFGIKRLIGQQYSHPNVQKILANYKFTIENDNDKIIIPIKMKDICIYFTPEEISALVLMELKNCAEAYIDEKVSKAVITVPAHFDNFQRQATIDAANLAGFEEVKLLNEPTAAAIEYTLDNVNKNHTSLIFDLGGGTFDVSIISFRNNEIKVRAIDGDSHLGGDDITNNITNYYINIIMDEITFDITKNRRQLRRLQEVCETAKIELTFSTTSEIEVISIFDDIDLKKNLSRTQFELLNDNLFNRTLDIVKRCISSANINKEQIDHVVLVGGSTRIIKIQTLLQDYFCKPLKFSINPDEAVALGAAIVASNWHNDNTLNDILFTDITTWSIGQRIKKPNKEDFYMDIIIPRFSRIPVEKKRIYATNVDDATKVDLCFYCGEDELTKHNQLLGHLLITDITPAPAGAEKFDTTLRVDTDGLLHIKAVIVSSQKEFYLTLPLEKGKLTDMDKNDKKEKLKKYFKKSNVLN